MKIPVNSELLCHARLGRQTLMPGAMYILEQIQREVAATVEERAPWAAKINAGRKAAA
jgi:hypothetical protein